MRACVYDHYGSFDALRVEEIPMPSPGPGQVRVRVRAAAVNSWDVDLVRGAPRIVRLDGGLRKPKRRTVGCDVAGIVDAVGPDVSTFRVGDPVFGDLSGGQWGAFAEYVVARSDELARKPESLSFEEAAATPQAGLLAWQAMIQRGALESGQHVLINGAGGGVGTFGIQIAKALGARVTAVDRGDKLELLQSLGADHVIDYSSEDFAASATPTYDLIVDNVATRPMRAIASVLKPGGSYQMVGGRTGRILQVVLVGWAFGLSGGRRLRIMPHVANRGMEELLPLLEDGSVKPIIDRVYPLEQIAEAIGRVGNGDVRGKVIVTP